MVTGMLFSNVILTCATRVQSNPRPKISLKRPDGTIIQDDSSSYHIIQDDTVGVGLAISELSPHDLGHWNCTMRTEGRNVLIVGGEVDRLFLGEETVTVFLKTDGINNIPQSGCPQVNKFRIDMNVMNASLHL